MWGVALVAAGCGDDHPGGGDRPAPVDASLPGPGDAQPVTGALRVSWTLEREAQPIGCDEAGAAAVDGIEVRVTPVVAGPALVLDAECEDGQVAFDELEAGSYVVRVSSMGGDIPATEKVVAVEAGTVSLAALVLAAPSGGTFLVSWYMEREGVALSCEDLGWGAIMFHDSGDVVPCSAHLAEVGPYPIGQHTIKVYAFASPALGSTLGAKGATGEIRDHGEVTYVPLLFEYFDEPEDQLRSLFAAARDHYQASSEPRQFPPTTTITPDLEACTSPSYGPYEPSASWWNGGTWQALGFSIESRHWARYQFVSSGTGTDAAFEVRAILDTDCDGSLATYWMTGAVDADGTVIGGEAIFSDLQD